MRTAFPFRYRIRTLLTLVTLVALFMACVRLIPGGSVGGSLANGRWAPCEEAYIPVKIEP